MTYQIQPKTHFYILNEKNEALIGFKTPEEATAHVAAMNIAETLLKSGKIKAEEWGIACIIIEQAIPYIPREITRALRNGR